MKKINLFVILITIILFTQNIFAFSPTFYVGDGFSGQASQCQTPNYLSITSAIVDIRNQSIQNPTIILCEGTYIENIDLSYSNNFSLIGENEHVIIKSPAQEDTPLKAINAENLILKNLKINEANLKGIVISNSINVFLEDITVSNIKGIENGDESLVGILIDVSNDVTFSGDLLIENINKNIKSTNGIEIVNCENILFNTDSLIIHDIKSNNNYSDSLLTGIKINNSILEIRSNIIISEIEGRKNTTGFLIENGSLVTNLEPIEIGITSSNSGSLFKGLEVKDSTLNLNENTLTNFFLIGTFMSDVYGLSIINSDQSSLGKLELSMVNGLNNTYAVNIIDSDDITISKIDLSNNQTENLVRLININNSNFGTINEIIIGPHNFTLQSNNFKVLNLINSAYEILKIDTTSANLLHNCITAENNSILKLNNINLSKCAGNHIKNTSSQIEIRKSPTIDLTKLEFQAPLESSTKIYKEMELGFFKEGRDLSLESLHLYSGEEFYNIYENAGEKTIVDLLYYKKGYNNGILEENYFNNYSAIGIKSKLNEKPEEFYIDNLLYESQFLEFYDLPEEFIHQTSKTGAITESVDHFFVEPKAHCIFIVGKSYGCFDIKLSRSLEENNNYTLKFKIPVSWINNNSLVKEDISLYHFESGKYYKQKTTPLAIEDGYQIFISEVDSFSEFQISGVKVENDLTPTNPNPTPVMPDPTPPVNDPITPPADSNIVNPDCNITCDLDTEIFDYINCVCIEKYVDPCKDISCKDTEYLDPETCECNSRFDFGQGNCRGVCDVGYTMDQNTCTCVPVILDGLPNGHIKLFNIGLIIFVIVVGVILYFIFRKKIKKDKPNKIKTKKINSKK